MALVRLGDYIELVDERNKDEIYSESDVRGISTSKAFIETKANLNGVNLSGYKIVRQYEFAYVADTSRRGEKIALAYADEKPCIISSIYTVFKVKDDTKLLPRYLMMFFNRSEFDRYARFNSWGSARETFSWEDFCDIKLNLPSIDIQRKYVAIYEGLLKNLKSYESRLYDLKLTCDGTIEKLLKLSKVKLKDYIIRRVEKNSNFMVSKLIGVGKNGFISPKQGKDETNGHICYLVEKNDFVFAPPQIHQGSIDIWNNDETVKCSDAYIVFYVCNPNLLKSYLFAILKTPFFQKWAAYYREGVREQLDFEQLKEYKLPIPDLTIQKDISNLYISYQNNIKRIDELKEIIKTICPILIKGSIDEEKKEESL